MALEDILLRIDILQKEAEALRPIDKERIEKLNAKLRLDWTYHSNAIEGNTLTLNETRVLLQQGIHMGNKLGRHYEEMKLHEDVILALEEIVHSKVPLTEVLIRNLHHQLMGDEYFSDAIDSLGNTQKVKGRPGEYKDKANGVKRIVNGKEKFVPFKSPDEVRIEMPELITWYLDEEQKKELHPVAIAAILHYRFVTLHPFDDGNGRMGRILMNLALMRAGYVPAIVTVEEREQYIRNLAIAQDGGDLNPFIELVAEETLRSMELMVKAAKGESIEEPEDIEKKIAIWKKGLDNNRDVIQKSSSKLAELFSNSFLGLFNLYAEKIQSNFHDLFASVQYNSAIENKNGTSHGIGVNYLIKELNKQISIWDGLYAISIDIKMNGFLKNGTNTFYVSKKLKIEFAELYYVISSSGNIRYEKLYSEVITEKEQKEIVSKVIEETFDDIQRNIKLH